MASSKSYRKYSNSKGAQINERKKILASIKTLMDKKSPKARAEIVKYIEKYPNDMYGYYYYGKISQIANDLETAENAYQQVAESESSIRTAGIVGLGEVARLRGNNNLAKYYYKKAINESQNIEKYAIYALARLERLDGNYDEAFKILDLLTEVTSEVELEKARLLGIINKHEESLQLLSTITPENQKQERTIYYLMAMAYYNLKKYEIAKEYFNICRSYNIKDTEYYKILTDQARMHLDLCEYQEACVCCEEAYQDGQLHSGNTNLLMGLAKQGLGNYYDAIRNYEISCQSSTATDAMKSYTASKFRMGCLKYAAEDFEGAIKDLQDAIAPQLHPETSTLSILFASYMRIKDYKNAQEILNKMKNITSSENNNYQTALFELQLKKATNQPLPNRASIKYYRERQIVEYRKSEAIHHIETEHQQSPNSNNFSRTTNIKELYQEVQLLMTEETKAINDTMDKYLIDYPNAGYSTDGKILNKICIVALPGTKDILTMYPTDHEELFFCKQVKDEIINPPQENPQVARFKNRFEKFNQVKK